MHFYLPNLAIIDGKNGYRWLQIQVTWFEPSRSRSSRINYLVFKSSKWIYPCTYWVFLSTVPAASARLLPNRFAAFSYAYQIRYYGLVEIHVVVVTTSDLSDRQTFSFGLLLSINQLWRFHDLCVSNHLRLPCKLFLSVKCSEVHENLYY